MREGSRDDAFRQTRHANKRVPVQDNFCQNKGVELVSEQLCTD